MNWIGIASIGTALTFNKFDWIDAFQGAFAGLGAVALSIIVITLWGAWSARRRRDSQDERND